MGLITGTANPDILTGTALTDTIQGLGSDDVLYAFDGNDLLQGGDGDDILYAGSGDDTLDGGAGEDLFYGLSGLDTVTYASSLGALTLNLATPSLSTGDAVGDFFLSVESFILGNFADIFLGASAGEDAHGGNGNDALSGLAGNDILFGDDGDDTLTGGEGADILTGGAGNDMVSYADSPVAITLDLGAPGFTTGFAVGDVYSSIEGIILTNFADTLRLQGGTIRLGNGGAGNDSLNGGTAADTMQGGADDDVLIGGDGADVLDGGTGNDLFQGGAGADAYFGGDGNDAVSYFIRVKVNLSNPDAGTGDAKGDTFDGIEGLLFASAGSVYIGGAANLTVALTSGSMTCFAGTGAEHFQSTAAAQMALSYANAATAVQFTALNSLLIGQGGAVGDELNSVTSLTFTKFADILDMTNYFGSTPTEIYAGYGNDKLKLNLGSAQMIDGGAGKDRIDGVLSLGQVAGGGGNDKINLTEQGFSNGAVSVSGDTGNDVVSLAGYGQVSVDLGTGNDQLTSTGIGNTIADLIAGLGDDTVTGYVASGNVDGGAGNDVLHFDLVTAPGSLAILLGGDGDDVISLTVDIASGEAALGFLNGGAGNDQITSVTQVSDNIITSFVFDANWGDDSVTGFLDGTDRIDLHATGATVFADLTVSGDATHTLVEFGADSFVLVGLDVANFTDADVVFS